MGESAPFWRFSAASYPDLEGEIQENISVETTNSILNSESDTSLGVCTSVTNAYNPFIYLFIFWGLGLAYISWMCIRVKFI